MRTIERTTTFKRDFKHAAKGPHRNALETILKIIITTLATDESLDVRHRDHTLTGPWQSYRDCHVKPDLVLIYRTIGADRLILVRLGSHSELGL